MHTHIKAVTVPYAKPSSLVFAKPISKAAAAAAAPPLGMAAIKAAAGDGGKAATDCTAAFVTKGVIISSIRCSTTTRCLVLGT